MDHKPTLQNVFWVALGGAVGSLLRYITNTGVEFLHPAGLLLSATAVENVLGSFLMGGLFIILTHRYTSGNLNLFLLTGVIGSYTTYSGFGVEAFLIHDRLPILFFSYIFSQVVTGVVALFCGMWIGRRFVNHQE